MQAGDQTEWIEIQYLTAGTDSVYGRIAGAWTPLVALAGSPTEACPLWAQWSDMLPSRSEAVRTGLNVALNQSRVRIPYLEILRTITSAMRVIRKYEGDGIYQIVGGPAIIGQREWIEIVCEKDSTTL